MATLVAKDTSGIYLAGPSEAEVPERRVRAGKVFSITREEWLVRFGDGFRAQEIGEQRLRYVEANGTDEGFVPDLEAAEAALQAVADRPHFRFAGQIGPVHYRLDPFDEAEAFKEIDLDLLPSPDVDYEWANETNGFQAYFRSELHVGLIRYHRFIARYQRAAGWMRMRPLALIYENAAGARQVIARPQPVTPVIDSEAGTITWVDGFGPGLDFGYRRLPDQFEKFVRISTLSALPAPAIDTAGLQFVIVMALAWIPAFSASNRFAAGITTDETLDFDSTDLDTTDERLDDPGQFSFRDGLGRDCWWVQDPAGRDANQGLVPMAWSLRRRVGRVVGRFSAAYSDLQAAVFPVVLDTTMTEERLAANEDDAMNYSSTYPGDGNFGTAYGNHMLGVSSGYFYIPGYRYTPPLPPAATIDSADLTFKCYDVGYSTAAPVFYCEDADNPGSFVASTHEPYDAYLARTTASVLWTVAAAWTPGSWYKSTDLKTVVQEVVNRAGWTESNGMVFVVVNHDSIKHNELKNVCDSGGVGANGTKFNCTYTSAAAFVPQIRWW